MVSYYQIWNYTEVPSLLHLKAHSGCRASFSSNLLKIVSKNIHLLFGRLAQCMGSSSSAPVQKQTGLGNWGFAGQTAHLTHQDDYYVHLPHIRLTTLANLFAPVYACENRGWLCGLTKERELSRGQKCPTGLLEVPACCPACHLCWRSLLPQICLQSSVSDEGLSGRFKRKKKKKKKSPNQNWHLNCVGVSWLK